MSFFDSLTKVVAIDEDNSITLRALTYGEEQEVKAKAMRTTSDFDGKGEMVIDASALETLAFQKAIVSWTGPGFDGREVSFANIQQLQPRILELLKPVLNELRGKAPSSSTQKKSLNDSTN